MTYKQRLHDLALRMAEVSHVPKYEFDYWGRLPPATKDYKAELLYPLARLAIEEQAAAFKDGYFAARFDYQLEEVSPSAFSAHLLTAGLIPDKTETT